MASNVEIIRNGYESFDRGDVQTTLAMFREDIEWNGPDWTPGSPAGRFRGRKEVLRQVFQPIHEHNQSFALEPQRYYSDGDTVIVTGVFRLRRRSFGQAVEVPFAHLWTVHDGRADTLRAYTDVRELHELRRLSEAA